MKTLLKNFFLDLAKDLFAKPNIKLQWNKRTCIYTALYIWIIAGLFLRVYNVHLHCPSELVFSDTERHWKNGIEVINQAPMPLYDPLGYQVWMSVVGKLTQGERALTFIYASLLSILTTWFWYRFQRELFKSKTVALIGWGIISWLPSWTGIFSYYMTETLMLPMLGLSLWMSWRALRKQNISSFSILALLWTLTGIVRGIAAPMALGLTAYIWLSQKNNRRSKLLVMIAVVAPILAFTGYRSYLKTGMIQPLGHGTFNSIYSLSGKDTIVMKFKHRDGGGYEYWFGSPSIAESPLTPFSDWKHSRERKYRTYIHLDRQAEDWSKNKKRIQEQGPDWVPLMKEGLVYLFFGRSWPDTNNEHLIERINNQMRWVWLPLFIFAFGVLVYLIKSRWKQSIPLLLIFLFWLFVQGCMPLAVNEGRYRKPMEGLVLIILLLPFDRQKTLKKADES